MSVEVWARNPYNYVKECIEAGMYNVVWDQGILLKKHIDPYKFMGLYYGTRYPWKFMVTGGYEAFEVDSQISTKKPSTAYPIWKYGEEWDDLIGYLTSGYKKIVVSDLPNVNTGIGKSFVREISSLQEDYPDIVIHIHGLYSYRTLYGLSFKSVDFDGRTNAANNQVELPSGRKIRFDNATLELKWVQLLGMNPVDLKIPSNRCIYNIKSHIWGSKYFKKGIDFRTRRLKNEELPDIESPNGSIPQHKRKNPFPDNIKVKLENDQFICNLCSLQTSCTYFREGAVCIVPGSDGVDLANFFKTRDSDTIIEGLGTLLAASSRRIAKALDAEEDSNELKPETRRMINDVFDRGVKLAKLVDPRLAAAGAAKINLTQNNAVLNSTPQALMAAIVDQFVQRGIPRDAITPEMVLRVINQPESLKQKAIEVAVSERIARDTGDSDV